MKFQSPSILLITVLVVAALVSSTSTTLDKPTASPCGDMLNKACNNNICKNGDIKCALQCFEKFNEAIMDTKSKDCQISSDALDVLKMAVLAFVTCVIVFYTRLYHPVRYYLR